MPGFGCIKHLKVSGNFLQSFSAFQRIFLSALLDHSAKGGLMGIRNPKE